MQSIIIIEQSKHRSSSTILYYSVEATLDYTEFLKEYLKSFVHKLLTLLTWLTFNITTIYIVTSETSDAINQSQVFENLVESFMD